MTGDEPGLGGQDNEDNSPALSQSWRYCKRCQVRPNNGVLHTIVLRNITMTDVLCDDCYRIYLQYVDALKNAELVMEEPVRDGDNIRVVVRTRVRFPPE